MEKNMAKSTMVREGLKAVVGESRYAKLMIYADKRKSGTRVKVQQLSWARLEDNEVQQVVDYVKEKYGVDVSTKSGVSGSRLLGYVAFYL